MTTLYHILDWFFLVFHSLLILFNIFGWMWKPTRKANLVTLTLTGLSWFVLGIFYGIGYCPLTDWHFDVLRNLGVENLPVSYIKYLIDRILNVNINANYVEVGTGVGFFVALIISVNVNFNKMFKKH